MWMMKVLKITKMRSIYLTVVIFQAQGCHCSESISVSDGDENDVDASHLTRDLPGLGGYHSDSSSDLDQNENDVDSNHLEHTMTPNTQRTIVAKDAQQLYESSKDKNSSAQHISEIYEESFYQKANGKLDQIIHKITLVVQEKNKKNKN